MSCEKPLFGRERKVQGIRIQKNRAFEDRGTGLLREKRGRRAIVVVGIVDIVRVELDLVVVEVEVRSVVERLPIIGKYAFIHP